MSTQKLRWVSPSAVWIAGFGATLPLRVGAQESRCAIRGSGADSSAAAPLCRRSLIRIILFALSGLQAAVAWGDSGPWKLEELRQPPQVDWIKREGPLRSLYYPGEPYGEKPTRVFAYYAVPEGRNERVPAIVLVHGGGGKAFPEWAWMWAKRGYAAIAMDLRGRGPDGEQLADAGPDLNHENTFDDIARGLREAWPYHAIASIVRAVSFLQAQPEVDRDRIGITGISWGGYLTAMVSGIDRRLKVAVPVYGCGFVYRNSPWVKNLEALTPELRRQWVENFDPSKYLPNAKMPILWVNRTNDFHYRMDNYRSSYMLPTGPQALSIVIDRKHNFHDGSMAPEIGIFLDQHLRGGVALPSLEHARVDGNQVSAKFTARSDGLRARLVYTLEDPTSEKSLWESRPANITAGEISADLPSPRPRAFFLALSDDRGATVSTPYLEGAR